MNHIEELLKRTFISNHKIQEGKNPDSIYLISFTDKQLDFYSEEVENSLKTLNRNFLLVEAKEKTLMNICEDILGYRPSTLREGLGLVYDLQIKNDIVLVFKELSKSNSVIKRENLFRGFIKNLDDAHLKNLHPKSDLIFIDSASFLEKHWDYIGPYLVYNLWPNSLTKAEQFTNMLYLDRNKN